MSDSPLIKVLREKISPLLEEIETLKDQNITKISLPTPTIVFFGEKSDGKSSLIRSLSGISLPVGEDGNTSKHPLILKITGKPNHKDAQTEFFMEDEKGVMSSVQEDSLSAAFKKDEDTDKRLKLLVKKVDHPDVTLIDLPAGTNDAIINEFISPKGTVVVNVVASEDCFSKTLISSNHEIAKRSLVAFTKVDKLITGSRSARNLAFKLTADNAEDRFICVRNQVGKEDIKAAIDEQTRLLKKGQVLSGIDKKHVGLKALAEKLVKVYLSIISNTLAKILHDIDDDIRTCNQVVGKLGKPSVSRILQLTENNLRISFLSREFVDVKEPATFFSYHLHCIVENFYNDLKKMAREFIASKDPDGKFLMYELNLLKSNTSLGSFFKPLGSMSSSILKQSFDIITKRIHPLVKEVMDFVDGCVTSILTAEAESHPQLLMLLKEASNNLTKKLREDFRGNVIQLIESERDVQFTLNPDFNQTMQKKIENACNQVLQLVKGKKESGVLEMESYTDNEPESSTGVETKLGHLQSYSHESLSKALNLRFKTDSYRNEMLKRFCDMVGIHLHHLIKKFIDETFYIDMTMELREGLKTLKEKEPISLSRKRENFKKRKEILQTVRELIQKQVMEVSGAFS